MATSATEWLAAYSEALGIDAPTEEEINEILALAGVAAHSSERTAAPVACWLAARAGRFVERCSPPGRRSGREFEG